MKLEEYLEAIRQCPDGITTINGVQHSLLDAHYGVYDNYSILLNTNYKELVDDFMSSPNEHFKEAYLMDDDSRTELKCLAGKPTAKCNVFLRYDPGTVVVQIRNHYAPSAWVKEVWNKQQQHFNTTIMLHPSRKKKMAGKHHHRVMSEVIDEIYRYAMTKNIPLCLFDAFARRRKLCI